jgi:parallel beta-helix repeat protein
MIEPTDGMVIEQDTVFKQGVYYLPNGIVIGASNVTLDGSGALLIGKKRNGYGVGIERYNGVTIKNLKLREYEYGIRARHSSGLTISGCQITSTREEPPNTLFLDIWLNAEQAYGGGILLWRVEDSAIINNDLQHQMNGLLTYQCQRLTVKGNVANYNSGFGIHLYATSNSLFEGNYADFCCRYQPRGERQGHMGADAAGFLIVSGSSNNIFRRNYARMGGDGFFMAGLNPNYEHVSCDDNRFEENDASYSPNIGFESTFCKGNVYINNTANHCNYGFWLGFSEGYVLEDNVMMHNAQAGIAVENGCDFRVQRNTFQENGHGILLWSKHMPDFEAIVPKNTTSYDWLIENNTFIHNGKAIRIAADQDHGVRPYEGSAPRPRDHVIQKNRMEDNRMGIELVNCGRNVVRDNTMRGNVEGDLKDEKRHPLG